MNRFCANCGTEVDETAVFCPTCGQPIDQETEASLPPAPAWPDAPPAGEPRPAGGPSSAGEPQPGGRPAEVSPAVEAEEEAALPPPAPPRPDLFDDRTAPAAARAPVDEPTRTGERVEAGPPPGPAGPPPPAAAPSPGQPATGRPAIDLPITLPVTLSAWLIGGGSALGAIGALIALFDTFGAAIDLLALVALAAVAASVFLSSQVPAIPHLRFVTLAIVLVAFGVALDRLGFGAAGAGELLLFLGTAAAAIGAILLELGRDQPLGGPQR